MQIYKLAKKELFHVLPCFIFFSIAFILINFAEDFALKGTGINPLTFANILLAAGVIAKVVLVIDHLPLTNLFRRQPLIYNMIWKTLIYWLITLMVRVAVRLVPFLFRAEPISIEYQQFVTTVNWNLFIAIQLWYGMLFFLFVTGTTLVQLLGKVRVKRIFFGKKR